MTVEEFSFGVAAVNGAPIENAAQLRYKAVWLQFLADEADRMSTPADAEQAPE